MSDDVDIPANDAPLASERRLRALERRLKAQKKAQPNGADGPAAVATEEPAPPATAPATARRPEQQAQERHSKERRAKQRAANQGPAATAVTEPPAAAPIPFPATPPRPPGKPPENGRQDAAGDGQPPAKPRVRKLRLFFIVFGLAVLALLSTIFGMLMAVASDIPQIENRQEYAKLGDNSYLYDDHWRPIGIFAASNPEVIDKWQAISPAVINAVLAVEDRRFWSDPGVDVKGIVRAFVSDVSGGHTQGASTITEQFVKNALQQQGNRTIFEKLREAALAFHLTRKWKPTKILTEYLNSVYFGNGAYGIESAARVYFGRELGYDPNSATDGGTSSCGDATTHLPSCASKLRYWQAALLAGMIADPSAYDPITDRQAATERRDLVLRDMLDQHYITRAKYQNGIRQPVPRASDLQQPSEPGAAPYFTSWLRPQIKAALERSGLPPKVAEYRAYYGGLKIRTTLDLKLQQAAEQSIASILPSGQGEPTASLVTIDNRTGEVRAMVGGPIVSDASGALHEDYKDYPFNLATQAERQPGSAFKPFTLAVALESGYGPSSVLLSAPADFIVPHSGGKEIFHVRNFGNTYSGPITLQAATDISDNSVYSRLGIQGLGRNGTKRIQQMAVKAGIRTPVSTNDAMILGGLRVGVSPLDMAHAYETFAEGGRRVFNRLLGSPDEGPTGITELKWDHHDLKNHPTYQRVMPASVAAELHSMLTGPVQSGTATAAAISGVDVAGKTGTTSNYADAWFVGWTPQLTTAVWVGFPNKLVPMTTLYNGGPVEGGTFPAVIWHAFMVQALQILAAEQPKSSNTNTTTTATTLSGSSALTAPSQTAPSTTSTGGPSGANSGNGTGGGGTANGGGGTGAGTGASGGGTGAGTGTGAGSGTGAGTGSGTGSPGSPSSGSGSGSGGAGIGGG